MTAPTTTGRGTPRPGDAGYGWVGYLVIAGVVALIVGGAAVLVTMVVSALSAPAEVRTTGPTPGVCTGATWFDPTTASCVPRAVCRAGEVYDPRTNICAVPGPALTAIEPNSGLSSGGTQVRITGAGFVDGATVTIDGSPATDVTVVSPTSITATTPASRSRYPVDVTVTNPTGPPATLDNVFVYVEPAVRRVSAINPPRGSKSGGEAVIVHGTGFTPGTKVAFGGRAASDVEVLNETTLRVITPIGDGGPVSVNVTIPGIDTYVAEDAFTYVNAVPRVVMAIRPQQGAAAGGTKVTIVGTGFAKGAAVAIGGHPARKVTVVSSTRITAVTPAGTLGPANVAVRNPKLPAAILVDGFEYVAAPTVDAIAPAKGPEDGGTKVTVTGTGFAKGAEVTFGGQPATDVTVVSDTRITALTPPGSVGPVAVVVTNPDQPPATVKKGFTYSPASAPAPGPTKPPKPTTKPACLVLRAPARTVGPGDQLTLIATDLFGTAPGLKNPRLVSAQLPGGADTGDIAWQAHPPRIIWLAPDTDGATATITFAYRADSCQGIGTGTVTVETS